MKTNGQLYGPEHLQCVLNSAEMAKVKEQKQDENHEIEQLEPRTQVELEVQHHLPFLPVPFPAWFFLIASAVYEQNKVTL